MNNIHRCLLVMCLLLALCACQPQANGVLTGKVTVGPLSPVVRSDEAEPTPPPEVFTSRGLAIYQGSNLVQQVKFNADGTYRVELAPGKYQVNLDQQNGIEFARVQPDGGTLPLDIEIKEGETVTLNLDIDTGIR